MRSKASLFALVALPALMTAPLLVSSGCSSGDSATPMVDAGSDATTGVPTLDEPTIPCEDAEAAIYGDPGAVPAMDASQRGAIVKCSKAGEIGRDAIQARLDKLGYAGKPITSGARVHRVLFRTERGDAAGTPGFSSAIVFAPTTPRAENLPVVVAARGTRGQAADCAISKVSVEDESNDDYARLALPVVGNGYAVIIPDLAGYANYGAPGNPPSAYAQFADVGKSTLDGSRALKRLYPQLASTTVLIGHSQGGHSALSALALSESYGAEGPIAGVAVYAPLWLSQRSWGALLEPGVASLYKFSIDEAPLPNAVSIWYHYTEAELLDGPGEGMKLFRAEKAEAVKEFVDSVCIKSSYPELKAIAASPGEPSESTKNFAYQIFDEAFVQQVASASAYGGTCAPGSACEKWLARYSADRPHLTGAAAKTPILLVYGGKDTTIPPERMRCALDRLKEDQTNLSVCYEPTPDHSNIIDARAEHVADWIASITLGGEAPPACAGNESAISVACATPPPND